MKVSYGYCHCGCGQETKLCKETDSSKGWIKGKPQKYIYKHILNVLHRSPKQYKYVFAPDNPSANNIGYANIKLKEIINFLDL